MIRALQFKKTLINSTKHPITHVRYFKRRKMTIREEEDLVPLPPPFTPIWVNHLYAIPRLYGPAVEIMSFFLSIIGLDTHQYFHSRAIVTLSDYFNNFELTPVKIIPRVKEGGCYIFFNNKEEAIKAVDHVWAVSEKKKSRIQAFLVKGEPFIEDIVMMKATHKLQLDLPATVTFVEIDDVYTLFRPYGKIQNISIEKNVVNILYLMKDSAISARNCLYNKQDNKLGGKMYLNYREYSRWRIWQHLMNVFKSPKLLPLLIFLVSLLLLLLIEPIRLTNVCKTLAQVDNQDDLPTVNLRADDTDELKAIVSKKPSSVLLVCGPPGSGKSSTAQQLIVGRSFALSVNCSSEKVGGAIEDALIENLESSIGFVPSFSAINTVWSYIEALFPSKTALYSSKLAQLDTLLSTLQKALKIVSILSKDEKKPIIIFDRFHDLVTKLENLPENSRHQAFSLIEGLLKWSIQTSLVNQSAHIILVGDNTTLERIKELDANLRGQIRTFYLEDLPDDHSYDYLSTFFHEEGIIEKKRAQGKYSFWRILGLLKKNSGKHRSYEDTTITEARVLLQPNEAKEAVEVVGGRIGDLTSLKQRIMRGQSLKDAIQDIVNESNENIVANGFGKNMAQLNVGNNKWNKIQLWKLIVAFSKEDEISYALALDKVDGNTEILQALVKNKFIEIRSGRNQHGFYDTTVKPASPLVLYSYKELVNDPLLTKQMQVLIKNQKQSDLQKEIEKAEKELVQLTKVEKVQRMEGTGLRKKALDDKLKDLHHKLQAVV